MGILSVNWRREDWDGYHSFSQELSRYVQQDGPRPDHPLYKETLHMATPNLLARLGSVNVGSYLAQFSALAQKYHITPDMIRTLAPTAATIVVDLAGTQVTDTTKATQRIIV